MARSSFQNMEPLPRFLLSRARRWVNIEDIDYRAGIARVDLFSRRTSQENDISEKDRAYQRVWNGEG